MLRGASGEPMPAAARRVILLVEDEVFIRLATAGYLMEEGFHVIQTETADQALEVLRSSTTVDLVLTDIAMPGTLDGCDLTNLIHVNWPSI